MASALQGTAESTARQMSQNILAQSQKIASDITTDTSSASSLVDTTSEMHRQQLEKTKLLLKRSTPFK